MRFAVFVMTYNRPEILGKTIISLLGQTYQPEKVLVIDNDKNQSAKQVVDKLISFPVSYIATGENVGPAGAAKIGLEILSREGFHWIGWMDDDDPPVFSDSFERLLTLGERFPNCGCVGAVGHYFNSKRGLIKRVSDKELEEEGPLYVDNIAGNMCKIINARVILEKDILPNEKLFFGFEELDFDLRVKNAGFQLMADKEIYKRNRVHSNRIGYQLIRGKKKEVSRLWREYYSTRNLLYILKQHKSFIALSKTMFRSILKSIVGFRFGFIYGLTNAKYILLGLSHFLMGKTGSLKTN